MQSHTLSTVCLLQFRGIGYLQYKSNQILAIIMSLLNKEGLKVLERQTQYGRVVLSLSVPVPVNVSVSVSVWIYVVEGLEALESRTRHGKAWDG